MEWRAQSRRVTLTSCMDEMSANTRTTWATRCGVQRVSMTTTRTNNKTTYTFTCQVSRFMCFVLVLVFTSSLVSDVLSFGFATRTTFQVSSCCSPTISCHRQFKLHPQLLLVADRENAKTGHLRCCPYRICVYLGRQWFHQIAYGRITTKSSWGPCCRKRWQFITTLQFGTQIHSYASCNEDTRSNNSSGKRMGKTWKGSSVASDTSQM